jgi:hypothetical protein
VPRFQGLEELLTAIPQEVNVSTESASGSFFQFGHGVLVFVGRESEEELPALTALRRLRELISPMSTPADIGKFS